MEALDNVRDVRRRDANAGVLNSKEGVVLAVLDEDADLALECVLESVADNVEADLWEDRPSRSVTVGPKGVVQREENWSHLLPKLGINVHQPLLTLIPLDHEL